MYQLTESELLQFEMAEKRLRFLREQHARVLEQAYEDINPTLTRTDYGLGDLYTESVNPAEYAIYLIELKEDHRSLEEWWRTRANTYKKAFSKLSDEEKKTLVSRYADYFESRQVRNKLKRVLSEIVSSQPELQRRKAHLSELESMEEADSRIDSMSNEELLEGYWDPDDLAYR